MKKMFSFILLAFICICGYAQTIDPALLEEMGRHRDNEKIRVFVIMRQQYDQQQLNLRADQFTTRAERREFVVNELKQFAEASQYDLRRSLSEMQRADLVTEPKVLWIANAISFEATRGAILSLADRSDIKVIGFDEERNWIPDGEASQPADPTREITWNVTQVNADQVWNLGYTGQGVVVAVIDSGVNYNHLDFADHLWDGGAEFPNHGYDVYDNDNDPMDEHVKYDQYGNIVSHGHGTHCAGTLCGDGTAGSQTGIAPDATLMCVKCTNSSGNCANSHIISAMQWAVDHGCDIISMSIGGNGDPPAEQTLLRNTCVNVLNAGVIAAIGAGNEGNKLSQYPIPFNVALPGGCPPPYLDPDQQQNPGGLSCSVCVGAVDSNDVAADFTSHGPCDWSESDYADYPYTPGSQSEFGLIRPDVCAPGVDIISTDSWNTSGYQTKDGTSMATPCVAGCMALLLSKNPNATPAELCRILEETAVPLSTGKSNIYGYGRVDALAAINAFAYDFSAVCSTGQTLYYNIVNASQHYVEITCPGTSSTNPWSGYTKPTGNIILPSYVTYGGVLYAVKRIGDNAFRGCSSLTGSLTIPNSVTIIGTYAFRGCSGFTGSLTIGNSVTAIRNSAFYGCSGFTGSLTIGNSVTSIGNNAFNGCSGFTSITAYPETPPTLGTNAFQNVPTGIPVNVPCGSLLDYEDASGWCEFYDFHRINNDCDLLTYSINADGVSVTVTGHVDGIYATGTLTIPETTTIDGVTYAVTAIGAEAFKNYTHLTGSLTIPNSVTTIGNYAFQGCTGFNGSLTISNSVTTIGNYAFQGCKNFNGSLTLPSSLTTLGTSAFQGCYGFTGSLTIPASLTTIKYAAFYGCTGFTGSLTIPNAVTSIENWAFGNCTGFTSMTVLPETPPSMGTSAFSYVPTDIPVYVPCGSLPDYQSASGWSSFTNMQCFLETLTVYNGTVTNNRIPAYIFYFDGFTRSQFVIPAADLAEMTGSSISSMTFYTTSQNIPYTTDCPADVYLKEVDYTSISAYESKASATTVYSGYFDIVSTGSGGEMTIYFNSPYIYNGGNLLVGIENTDYYSFRNIHFYGQTVSGASISGASASSTETIPADQQNFIPKTTFRYQPLMCAPHSLPYTYGFEEEGEFDCWTMLNCHTNSMIASAAKHQGDNGFQFHYTDYPPQYLISPEFEGTTGMDVSFYYKNRSDNYPETFQVGYSTTTKSPSAFTWHDEVTANDASTWMLYDDYFPEGTKYVAVKCTSYDQFYLYIDDFSFVPACSPKTLPYTYGFEDEDDFGCWTTLDCAGPTGIVDYEEDHVFQFYYNYNPPQYLISPKLVCTTAMNVSFYYKNAADDYPESFQVGYSTTTKSPSAFTWSPEVTASDESIWMLYEDYFPAGTKYVAVKLNSNDMWKLYLDDFSFIPTFCPLEDQCRLTFTLTDSYGDSWNGASINVVDVETGIVLATMTNVTHDHANAPITETYTLTVCDGRELRFEWVSGNWDSECSYVVTTANGTEIFSGSGAMSEPVTYSVSCSLGQTIALTAGWNWFSLYVEAEDPVTMLQMLEESLGENGLMIKSSQVNTEYDSEWGWFGDLDDVGMTNEQMYNILVSVPCTLTVEGTPANPENHPITIVHGWNWIGFPSGVAMSLEAAFDGFAQEGDKIKSSNAQIEYDPEWGWWGDFEMLEPGQGYMYYSASSTPRTLLFPEGAK